MECSSVALTAPKWSLTESVQATRASSARSRSRRSCSALRRLDFGSRSMPYAISARTGCGTPTSARLSFRSRAMNRSSPFISAETAFVSSTYLIAEAHLPFLGTRIANPNRVVDCDQPIDLGGVTVELLLVPGHTTANLAVWVAEDRVLYAGDTVVSDYRPNLASGAPSD
jgi:hypothetical protein